jgi:cytoskeletal protein CcmA (bactofilin family)
MFTRGDKVSSKQGTDQEKEKTAQETEPLHTQEQRSANAAYRKSTPSVISAALKVMGNLESAGEIQIDGKVEGDVRGLMVKVGEGASIKGSVFGDSVELAGTVEGKIEAQLANRAGYARRVQFQISFVAYRSFRARLKLDISPEPVEKRV